MISDWTNLSFLFEEYHPQFKNKTCIYKSYKIPKMKIKIIKNIGILNKT